MRPAIPELTGLICVFLVGSPRGAAMEDRDRQFQEIVQRALWFSANSRAFALNAPKDHRAFFLRQAEYWEKFAGQVEADARRIAESRALLLRVQTKVPRPSGL
jgi:hypothetical protein